MTQTNQPEFSPIEFYLAESRASRMAKFQVVPLKAKVRYEVLQASYSAGEPFVEITTAYSIEFEYPDVEDEPVAKVETKYVAVLEASRAITEEDAAEHRLDIAQSMANRLLHAYHRQTVINLSTSLGLAPFALPLTWENVEQNLPNGDD